MLRIYGYFYFLRLKTQFIYLVFQRPSASNTRLLRLYVLLNRIRYSNLYGRTISSRSPKKQKSNQFLLIYEKLEDLGGTNLIGVKIRDQLNFQKSTVREIDWTNLIALSESEREMLFEYIPVVINCKRALVYFSRIPSTHKVIVITWNQSDLYFKIANYLGKINGSFQICEPVLSKDLSFVLPIKNHSLHIAITNCHHKIVFPEIKIQPRLVFIGRLNYQKGLDIFLRLARGNPELAFIVIGSGPLEDFVEWQCFRQKNLTFLGKKENPLCFLRNTDIVILPSRYFEGLNLVLLEAIRHRVRVLSSGVGLMSKVHSDFHTFSYEKKMARDSYGWFQKKLEEIKS